MSLILDEAAYAVEAETMVVHCLDPQNLIMVGDPKQLSSPVIHSEKVTQCYPRSLFDRLMGVYKSRLEDLYTSKTREKDGSPHLLKLNYTMLERQYRMHGEICRHPSERYYDSNLKTGYVQPSAQD